MLTIVPEEFQAAKRILGAHEHIAGTQYFATPRNGDGDYDVVLLQAADRSNVPANEATLNVIEDFRPQYLFLVGIAGGVWDHKKRTCRDEVGLGDVVVADYVDYSEFRKLSGGKSASRRIPYDHPSHALRTKFTQPLCIDSNWASVMTVERPDGTDDCPRAHIGNIVAGEKLLGDPDNKYQAELLEEYDKAVAVDMESYGFARAIFTARWSVHYNPQCAIVRGISDIANMEQNNQTRAQWRDYAAEAAVAFVAAAIRDLKEVK